MWFRIVIAGILLMSVSTADAQNKFSQRKLQKLFRNKIQNIQTLAGNNLVIDEVQKQNKKNVSVEKVRNIDEKWASTTGLTPFKKSLRDNKVGEHFKSIIDSNTSTYIDVILTDSKGANVAVYPTAADYWQGARNLFKEAFNDGAGKVFVGEMGTDESTKEKTIDISVPVMDGGKAIGVIIVSVKLSDVQAGYLK